MLITIVVVAIVLVPLVRILALLAVRSRTTNQTSASVDPAATDTFACFCIRQAFDRDCAIIWDTQVPALQLIDRAGIRGVPIRHLKSFYVRSARSYPELYDGSTFASWLEFLGRELLITSSHGHLFITAEGQQFLAYRLVPEIVLALEGGSRRE